MVDVRPAFPALVEQPFARAGAVGVQKNIPGGSKRQYMDGIPVRKPPPVALHRGQRGPASPR